MTTTTSMAITQADENAIRDLVALAQESQSDPEALPNLHTAETAIVTSPGDASWAARPSQKPWPTRSPLRFATSSPAWKSTTSA
jgi:hypothetical protein